MSWVFERRDPKKPGREPLTDQDPATTFKPADDPGDLREFVYIDDVSVQSLLASRTGAIATDFTDIQSEADKRLREVNAKLGYATVGVGAKGSNETSTGLSAQVVRKSTEQARFKELRELELDRLLLRAAPPSPATAGTAPQGTEVVPSFEEMPEHHPQHLVGEQQVKRGKLFELDIELETEPTYGVGAAITSLISLFEKSPELVPEEDRESIRQVAAVAGMLDQLLGGLVPIRARALDFQVLQRAGRSYVIHNDLVARLPEHERSALEPLQVVGHVDPELFWKDTRRVLFAKRRYTVMARVAADGLPGSWQPVQLVDQVDKVSPELAQLIASIRVELLESIGGAARPAAPEAPSDTQAERAFGAYRDLVAHELGMEPEAAVNLCGDLAPVADYLSREPFRELAAAVAERLSGESEQTVPPERNATLRDEAIRRSLEEPAEGVPARRAAPPLRERFLNAEFVAIYW